MAYFSGTGLCLMARLVYTELLQSHHNTVQSFPLGLVSSILVVTKVCSMDSLGSATSSQGIRHRHISLVASFKCTYFFNYRNNVSLKIILELL